MRSRSSSAEPTGSGPVPHRRPAHGSHTGYGTVFVCLTGGVTGSGCLSVTWAVDGFLSVFRFRRETGGGVVLRPRRSALWRVYIQEDL